MRSIPSVKAEHPNLHAGATDELTTLRAQLAEAMDGLEKIAYLEDCNISGSEYRIGVADGCRTSATIARKYLDELKKVTTA